MWHRTVHIEIISNFMMNKKIFGPIFAGLIGLIPNCASSVIISELYLSSVISFGSLMAGLLVNAGIGVLVLFRMNHNSKENIQILSILYFLNIFFNSKNNEKYEIKPVKNNIVNPYLKKYQKDANQSKKKEYTKE